MPVSPSAGTALGQASPSTGASGISGSSVTDIFLSAVLLPSQTELPEMWELRAADRQEARSDEITVFADLKILQ